MTVWTASTAKAGKQKIHTYHRLYNWYFFSLLNHVIAQMSIQSPSWNFCASWFWQLFRKSKLFFSNRGLFHYWLFVQGTSCGWSDENDYYILIHLFKIKRSKTHKRLKEHFLIRRNRTKRANEVILFFKLRTIQQKTVKPTCLLSVRCQEAGGRIFLPLAFLYLTDKR